jgi:N-acetylneuraminate synthase
MSKTIIIAEIGINHNGDINIAKEMMLKSKFAKADIVKFQKRDIEEVYTQEFLSSHRDSKWGKTQRDQKEGLELSEADYDEINEYSKLIEIPWFASAWDLKSIDFLKKYDFLYNKIPSAMIVSESFLNEISKQKKYTFISTGMCEFRHIDKAVEIFKKNSCEFELMHCISAYPFDDSLANLKMINTLKEKYKCKVGYSGHEKSGLAISIAAVALGASSIERHVSLDRTMYGSDQAASITFEGLNLLIKGIRKVESALNGDQNKKILQIEKPIADKLRAHIRH